MARLPQLREGLNEVWKNLSEGWERLSRRAAAAITRFHPKHGEDAAQDAVPSAGWGVLAAEVFDDDDKVVVRLEAPGMDRSDFDLEIVDGHLLVRGEKRYQQERREGRYYITECAYGSFERALPLPTAVEADKASARYENGVLQVEIPKAPEARRRHLTIQVQ